MAHRRALRELLRWRLLSFSASTEGVLGSLGKASRQQFMGAAHPEEISKSKGRAAGAVWMFAAGLTAYTTSATVAAGSMLSLEAPAEEEAAAPPAAILPSLTAEIKPRVVFVLGGPGSGKGTQCAKIVDDFGFVHLSAGDLLRAEINSGSENGNMIKAMIKEGKIVPAEVTVALLQKAMKESGTDKFLIDGFPRNEDNRMVFERDTGIEPEFILFFDCPEEVMEKRLLGRNQGRIDDNIETIRKRFKVFIESSLPVVEHYEKLGKVRKINATKAPDDVFKSLSPLFLRFLQSDLLEVSRTLLQAIDSGDYSTYAKLCDPGLTAFEPEAQGQLVEGLDFHKFYFDLKAAIDSQPVPTEGKAPNPLSTIASPRIVIMDNIGLVTYTRLKQQVGQSEEGMVASVNETRVWERRKVGPGKWEWKHLHVHRSKCPTQ